MGLECCRVSPRVALSLYVQGMLCPLAVVTAALPLLQMIRYASEAELSAQREFAHLRKKLQQEKDKQMLSSMLACGLADKLDDGESEMKVQAGYFLYLGAIRVREDRLGLC